MRLRAFLSSLLAIAAAPFVNREPHSRWLWFRRTVRHHYFYRGTASPLHESVTHSEREAAYWQHLGKVFHEVFSRPAKTLHELRTQWGHRFSFRAKRLPAGDGFLIWDNWYGTRSARIGGTQVLDVHLEMIQWIKPSKP